MKHKKDPGSGELWIHFDYIVCSNSCSHQLAQSSGRTNEGVVSEDALLFCVAISNTQESSRASVICHGIGGQ